MDELDKVLLLDAQVVICFLKQEEEAASERLLVELEAGLRKDLRHLLDGEIFKLA